MLGVEITARRRHWSMARNRDAGLTAACATVVHTYCSRIDQVPMGGRSRHRAGLIRLACCCSGEGGPVRLPAGGAECWSRIAHRNSRMDTAGCRGCGRP